MTYKLPGGCLTTAMGILPHRNLEDAMKLAFSVDVPFWPQIPRMSYYEDMYVQSSEKLPGIHVDTEKHNITLSTDKFYEELPQFFEECDTHGYYQLTEKYSVAFDAFLNHDLSSYKCIRGQSVGPISFGFKITDENKKPIAYNDEIRGFMFDFMAEKCNAQYRQLKEKNDTALVWMDEPGLQMLFASFTGYTAERAAEDYRGYLEKLEGPKGVHLCGNPDWSFLLSALDLDILSMDSYSVGHIFTRYKEEVVNFLKKGAIISWGITPTLTEELTLENFNSLKVKLEEMFAYVSSQGIAMDELLDRSWFAPSRCCLVNPDLAKSVEDSFRLLRELGNHFKEKYKLY
ncbi:MAG TPA: hypothetical protein PKD52_08255 [Clostridiales bacterium]|nr:hypothetical protein [Clostridiales bacterium]